MTRLVCQNRSGLPLFFSLIVIPVMAANAFAQAGSLRGQITDQNGAIVVGAKVTAASSPGQTRIIGNISSPLFGQANQPSDAGGFGFSESANNRRFELQTRLTF